MLAVDSKLFKKMCIDENTHARHEPDLAVRPSFTVLKDAYSSLQF